ncbi:hypothetical protein [Rhodococcus sp. RS1C4]|nr:hypothetical protein [Rhodococcus sp. RS1C4]
MTTGAPGVPVPGGSYTVRPGQRWGQDETPDGVRQKTRNPPLNGYGRAQDNLRGEGGLLGQIVGAITGGRFFNLGGLSTMMGGLTGAVENVVNEEIPRLDNRIDQFSEGGSSAVRAAFFQDGTWTKPEGYSRHIVKIIGAASGGGRSNGVFDTDPAVRAGGSGEGAGGYAGGCNEFEFFDADLPATVNCVVGMGGLGATSDNQAGAGGGLSSFGPFGSAGGALPNAFGYGAKTRQLRGGTGGFVTAGQDYAARPGTGHDYANGGAAGMPNNSGNPGGPGNRPNPETLAEYGTGGGGGARKGGTGNGGNGGNGANPGGPGGGGGAFNTFGFAGQGGNGAHGAIFITSYK